MEDGQLLRRLSRTVRDTADSLRREPHAPDADPCPYCRLLVVDGDALLRDREAWMRAGRELIGRTVAYLRRVEEHAQGAADSLLLEDVAVWVAEALGNDVRLWEDANDTRRP